MHDFVPLFTQIIKIVNQPRAMPLFTENRSSRCTDLFRFLCPWLRPKSRLTGHLKCSASECSFFVPYECLDSLILKEEGALICSALKVKPTQKRNLHDFVPLHSPLA